MSAANQRFVAGLQDAQLARFHKLAFWIQIWSAATVRIESHHDLRLTMDPVSGDFSSITISPDHFVAEQDEAVQAGLTRVLADINKRAGLFKLKRDDLTEVMKKLPVFRYEDPSRAVYLCY